MKGLSTLPESYFGHFEKFCAVPHGSGNLDAISGHCADFAESHGLNYVRDEHNNVVIYKPGTKGCEHLEPVVIQGHMDMVCEKAPGVQIDFLTQGVTPCTDGEKIWADGTTLGADDGISVAFMFALLEETDIPHPPLEMVITTDEETGMDGAMGINPDLIKGRRMINIDSEDMGVITVSCAGGAGCFTTLPISYEPYSGIRLAVSFTNLTGGHSGVEIGKGVANANSLLGRLLYSLKQKHHLRLISAEGGSRSNVIPVSAKAEIVVDDGDLPGVLEDISQIADEIKSEYAVTDPNMTVTVSKPFDFCQDAFTEEDTDRAINLIFAIPHGVLVMSPDMEGLVQTSTNFAILRTENGNLVIQSHCRSSVDSQKEWITNHIAAISALSGAKAEISERYAGWKYNPNSPLRDTMIKTYKAITGKDAKVEALHAGLECGLFAEKLKGLDCVSIGPNMRNVHTPSEYIDVESCRVVYNWVKETLKALCEE